MSVASFDFEHMEYRKYSLWIWCVQRRNYYIKIGVWCCISWL